MPDVQAKAQAEALVDALCQGGQDLAAKTDIAELRMATRADLAEVGADIAKLQTDLAWVRWIVTGGVGLYVLRSIAEWIR